MSPSTWLDLESEIRFGRLLVRQGMVSPDRVDQEIFALKTLQDLGSTWIPTLAEVFIQTRVLTEEQVDQALESLRPLAADAR